VLSASCNFFLVFGTPFFFKKADKQASPVLFLCFGACKLASRCRSRDFSIGKSGAKDLLASWPASTMMSIRFVAFFLWLAVVVAVTEYANVEWRLGHDLSNAGRAFPNAVHKVFFLVKHDSAKLKEMHDELITISTPTSSRYGEHWTRARSASYAIVPGAVQTTVAALEEAGCKYITVSQFGEIVSAVAKVHVWEKLFSTQFFNFERVDVLGNSQSSIIRALEYTLPNSLVSTVEAAYNTVQFPSVQHKREGSTKPLSEEQVTALLEAEKSRSSSTSDSHTSNKTFSGYVTIGLLNEYYNIKNNTGNSLASQGVFEMYGSSDYSPSDLKLFQKFFGLPEDHVGTKGVQSNYSRVCYLDPYDYCVGLISLFA